MKRTASTRTKALKHILEGAVDDPIININIKEDLIEDVPNIDTPDTNIRTVTFGLEKAPNESKSSTELSKAIELFHRLIDRELVKSTNLLDIDKLELKAWIDLQIEVPAKTILHLLRAMQSLHLDPLNEQIGFTQYEDGAWQVFITIEGCSKLLNNHSQFNGLAFTQSETLVEGVPEWIECSIYRRDRILPITVREHYLEVRGANAIWQKMPRRMLRHKALQQCVRLAL
jgi:hypothetical protein